MKNIVIINSSPRKDGNSEILAKSFADGAKEAGNNVEFIKIREKRINYCRGCYACRQLGKCFQDDDMNDIVKKLVNADVILFSTPVYFYTMNGQMKVFIDRCVQKYTKIHADIYIFVSGGDTEKSHLKLAVESIRGLTRDCFEGCEEKGCIISSGVTEMGDVSNKEVMTEAFYMGKNA